MREKDLVKGEGERRGWDNGRRTEREERLG
jgi:hypothetical protein